MKTFVAIIFTLCLCPVANAQCLAYSAAPSRLVASTGVPQLDYDLELEARRLEAIFGVRAVVRYIDDQGAPNAYASPEGVVYLGATLMNAELRDNKGGPTAIIGIEAHEFGHILQMSRGTHLVGKQMELQADFMAGWYLARQFKTRKLNPWQFLYSVYDKGDFNFFDPQHHGTPQERADAMLAGYKNAKLPADQALLAGQRFVTVGQ
jgi:hypothetical protein